MAHPVRNFLLGSVVVLVLVGGGLYVGANYFGGDLPTPKQIIAKTEDKLKEWVAGPELKQLNEELEKARSASRDPADKKRIAELKAKIKALKEKEVAAAPPSPPPAASPPAQPDIAATPPPAAPSQTERVFTAKDGTVHPVPSGFEIR